MKMSSMLVITNVLRATPIARPKEKAMVGKVGRHWSMVVVVVVLVVSVVAEIPAKGMVC